MSSLYRDTSAAQVSLQRIENFIVIDLSLNLRKRDVRSRDRDVRVSRPRRWSVETKTRPRLWSDGIETTKTFEKTPRDRLETETFETETTTLTQH